MKIWDREEGELTPPGGLNFSPPPAPGEANKFCYEANIITFGETDPVGDFEDEVTGATKSSSNVMGSHLSKAFTQLSGDYGWAQLEFGAGGGQSLPVIGVRLETRKKENNPSASYGFANAHSYKRNVEAYTELPRWENQFDRSIPQLPTDGR